jgi:hypothetical protein
MNCACGRFITHVLAREPRDPKALPSADHDVRWLITMTGHGHEPPVAELKAPSATMPSQEPQRTAEAMRRALPDLLTLKPARFTRRDRAIRSIASNNTI